MTPEVFKAESLNSTPWVPDTLSEVHKVKNFFITVLRTNIVLSLVLSHTDPGAFQKMYAVNTTDWTKKQT